MLRRKGGNKKQKKKNKQTKNQTNKQSKYFVSFFFKYFNENMLGWKEEQKSTKNRHYLILMRPNSKILKK